MGADCRAKQVISAGRIRDPIPQCFVNSGAQGLVAGFDREYFSTETVHAIDIRRLSFHINGAHVNAAWQTDPGTCCSRSDTVLSGAGLRYDAFCAKLFGKQCLPDRVVDFVCARMCEVLSL